MFGPVWVSKGDSFSGLGSRDFILKCVKYLKGEKKRSAFLVGQIELAMGEERGRGTVTEKKYLSMGEDELYDALTKVGHVAEIETCCHSIYKKNFY